MSSSASSKQDTKMSFHCNDGVSFRNRATADLCSDGDEKLGRHVCLVSKGLWEKVGRAPFSSMPLPKGLRLFCDLNGGL